MHEFQNYGCFFVFKKDVFRPFLIGINKEIQNITQNIQKKSKCLLLVLAVSL